MFKYLHDGTYHTDTSDEYMSALELDDDARDSILANRGYQREHNLKMRAAAYVRESDPLFLESQFDKTDDSRQRWANKVIEIKERYPL